MSSDGFRDDSEYWDAQATRVAAETIRRLGRSGVNWLANSSASWVAAGILVGVVSILVLGLINPSRSEDVYVEWAAALMPPNDTGQAMSRRDGPPSIGSLLLQARDGGLK